MPALTKLARSCGGATTSLRKPSQPTCPYAQAHGLCVLSPPSLSSGSGPLGSSYCRIRTHRAYLLSGQGPQSLGATSSARDPGVCGLLRPWPHSAEWSPGVSCCSPSAALSPSPTWTFLSGSAGLLLAGGHTPVLGPCALSCPNIALLWHLGQPGAPGKDWYLEGLPRALSQPPVFQHAQRAWPLAKGNCPGPGVAGVGSACGSGEPAREAWAGEQAWTGTLHASHQQGTARAA